MAILEETGLEIVLVTRVAFDTELSMTEKVATINEALNETIVQLNINTGDIVQLRIDVDAVGLDSAQIETNRLDIVQNVLDIATNLAGYLQAQSEVDAVEIRMTTAEGKISAVEVDIITLDGQVSALEAGAILINSAVALNASAIALNAGNITDQEIRISAEEARGTIQDTDIDALEANDIIQDADIDALEANEIVQDADIDALEASEIIQDADIDALEASEIIQDADIDALEANEIIQDADIDQLQIDVGNLGASATEKLTAFVGTNPSASKLEITYAKAYLENDVYFITNPRTFDGTGMTLSKDAGITEDIVKSELGVQVIGSAYNDNDTLWFRRNGTDFIILNAVSASGIEARLAGTEVDILSLEANDIIQDTDIDALEADKIVQDADIDAVEVITSDLLDGTQKANKAINDTDGLPIDTTYRKVAEIEVVEAQTGLLPTDVQWIAEGNVFYYDIVLSGFTALVGDKVDVNDLSLDEIDLALVQGAGIFYGERQTDTTVRIKALFAIDISSVDYSVTVVKKAGA